MGGRWRLGYGGWIGWRLDGLEIGVAYGLDERSDGRD